MNEPKRTVGEMIKPIRGALEVLGGIFLAITQFNETLKKAIDSLGPLAELPIIVWLLVAATLVIAGVFTLRDGLARRSRLLRPEALQLKADNPAHLKGRSEDIQRLSTLCHECQQVHLVGESGAGKSALIQAGLCPALKAGRRLFPIYLGVWGQDWQEGPRTALTYAFWEALSEEDRGTLGLATLPRPENLVVILDQCRAKLGRTPLLIFDQFDDYQTRHRTRFLAPRRRTWISADRLTEANAFWRDVKKLIDQKVVHCLFATRSDTADGLESIRFVDPQVYPLDRLNADFVLPLLTELTALAEGMAPVVFAPDRGWERLKERLARDLSEDGAVLPVQMKFALQGLASLRSLTVRDYARADRLRGLEAAYVEWRIVNTARHSSLTEIHVRSLLTSLAEPETLKTVPRSTADLAKTITVGNTADPSHLKGAVEVALEDLEKKEIVRRRLDPDTRQHVWVLDHDYLCRGVLEAERRANRWLALAQEGHRAFREAGGNIWWKLRSLLSPWQQMMLATARLRGRFRYGTLRGYAAWSLIPYLLMLTATVYGGVLIRQRQQAELYRAEAAEIRTAIGLHEPLSASEVDLLWKLAASNDAVRYSFLEQALEFPATAEQFNRRAEMAVHAIVGLDRNKREYIFTNSLLPRFRRPSGHLSIKIACVKIGIALSMEKRYPEFSRFVVTTFIEAPDKITDFQQHAFLGKALQEVAKIQAPAQAREVATQLLAAIINTTDFQQHYALGEALKVAAEQLAPAEAHGLATQLLTAITETSDFLQLATMVEALKALVRKLGPAEAEEITKQLFTTFDKTANFWQLGALAITFQAVSAQLAPAEAHGLATQLRSALDKTTNPLQLAALARALKGVAGELAPVEAHRVASQLLIAFTKTGDPPQLMVLAGALQAVAGELAPAEAQEVATRLLTAITKTTHSAQRYELGEALKVTAERLAPAERQWIVAQVLTAITKTSDPEQVAVLAGGIQAVAGELAPAEAHEVARQLLTAITKTTDFRQLTALGGALQAVVGKLGPMEAHEVARQLLTALDKTTNFLQLEALGKVLKVAAEQLAPAEGQWILTQLLTAITKTTDFRQLTALGDALQAVVGKLGPMEAHEVARQLLTAVMDTANFQRFAALGGAMRAAVEQMAPVEAQEVAKQLLAAISNTTDPQQLVVLAGALQAVAGKLAPVESQEVARQLLTASSNTTDSPRLVALGGVLKVVTGSLRSAEAQETYARFITVMERTSHPRQLADLAELLKSVAEKLAAADTQKAVTELITVMGRTTQLDQLGALAEIFKAMPSNVESQTLIDMLKWPTSVGVLRATLLEMLERQTYQKFDNNLWKMVTWAQANGLDVKSPPKRPDK